MDELYGMLGAVYGWCWIALLREYVYRLKYWPVELKIIVWLCRCRRPLVIRAGYMSRSRGLHWDRK